jgi:hypothetical protein
VIVDDQRIVFVGVHILYFVKPRTIPDAKRRPGPACGFQKLAQPRVLRKDTELGLSPELCAMGINLSHESGIHLIKVGRIVLVIHDFDFGKLFSQPHNGAS